MKAIIETSPLLTIYPSGWKDVLSMGNTDILQYRNLAHFKHHAANLTQREERNCGVDYAKALKDMLENRPVIKRDAYELIKNRVKQVLLKRGLISDSVYESYRYDVEGEGVIDVSKVIAQDPACILVPNETYTNYFYELYISISYDWTVSNETIIQNMAKILATVELLEREHYYCKITLIFPDQGCNRGDGNSNLLVLIPLFSHKDPKSIETMSAILNDRLLRKFCFAILEDRYGKDLASGYGSPVQLPQTINVGYDVSEIDLASQIIDKVVVPCQNR